MSPEDRPQQESGKTARIPGHPGEILDQVLSLPPLRGLADLASSFRKRVEPSFYRAILVQLWGRRPYLTILAAMMLCSSVPVLLWPEIGTIRSWINAPFALAGWATPRWLSPVTNIWWGWTYGEFLFALLLGVKICRFFNSSPYLNDVEAIPGARENVFHSLAFQVLLSAIVLSYVWDAMCFVDGLVDPRMVAFRKRTGWSLLNLVFPLLRDPLVPVWLAVLHGQILGRLTSILQILLTLVLVISSLARPRTLAVAVGLTILSLFFLGYVKLGMWVLESYLLNLQSAGAIPSMIRPLMEEAAYILAYLVLCGWFWHIARKWFLCRPVE